MKIEYVEYAIPIAITILNPQLDCEPVYSDYQIEDVKIDEDEEDSLGKPVRIDPMQEVISTIKSFEKFKSNWDGYGATQVATSALKNSIEFASALPESIIGELGVDQIVLTPYGTVVFDWKNLDELVSVEIGEEKVGFFSEFKDKSNPSSDGIPFNANDLPQELTSALNSLYKFQI